MYVSLIQNAALLIALSTLYGLVTRLRGRGDVEGRGIVGPLALGLLFGGVAVAGMLLPFRYEPGVIYDGRSVILTLAGLFGGGTGSFVSIVIAGAYRAYLGGPGVWAGLATIILCSAVGLTFRRIYHNRPETLPVASLYGLGVASHLVMLGSQLLIRPWPAGPEAIGRIWLPIMLLFPVATLLIGLLMSIEERRVVGERALRRARDYAENLIRTANVIFVELDREGRVVRLNEAAEEITGYSLDEIRGRNWFDTLVPGDRYLGVRNAFARMARDGVIVKRLENPIRTKGGHQRDIVWQNDLLVDGGEIMGTISFGMDITERKQAEELLRLTQFSVDHAVDSVFWTDPDGRLVYVSEATCKAHGYSRDEMLAMTLFDLDPSLSREQWASNWGAIRRQTSIEFETSHRTKEGTIFPVDVSANHVVYEDKEYNCVFARDITERKQAEEALREREDQLRQSQKMEAVGQLAGGIAHDFNNLLTAIIGYGDLLLSDPGLAGSPALQDVKEIKQAAERAAALTRQILAFSRRQALQPVRVSLNAVLGGMEPLLRRTLGANVDLVTLLHPDLDQSEVDVNQFEQVIMNLAINARDAMPKGGRLILETANVELGDDYCLAHPDARPGSFVMLSVSDDGVGIDEEAKSHIFEPFYTTKAPGAGTGLGLSTVYGIVRQSEGSIEVNSTLGEGTSFKVFLPRVEERNSASLALPVSTSSSGGGEETVLVVEDEEALRTLVTRILEGLGYTVLAASTAMEAQVILAEREAPIDLLLTDIVLPGAQQGNELAADLLSSHPGLPVLYMSGYTRDAIAHAGRLDEGVSYLQKPFTPETLGNKVREVLDRDRFAP